MSMITLTHAIILPYNFGTPGWHEFVSRWMPLRCYGLELDRAPKALIVARNEVEDWMADPEFRGLAILRLTTPTSDPSAMLTYAALPWPAQDISWESAPRLAGLIHRRDESYYLLTAAAPEIFIRSGRSMRISVPPLPRSPVALGLPAPPIVGPGDSAESAVPIATESTADAMPACTAPVNYRNALRDVNTARARTRFARYRQTFETAVRGTDATVSLLAAIGWRESRFNPTASNTAGALGMFQIMPATGESWNVTDRTDVAEAARAVALAWTRYYAEGRTRFTSDLEAFTFANSAYGQGLGNARRRLRSDDPCRAMYLRRMAEAFERMDT